MSVFELVDYGVLGVHCLKELFMLIITIAFRLSTEGLGHLYPKLLTEIVFGLYTSDIVNKYKLG
jgi:hypothetical protein